MSAPVLGATEKSAASPESSSGASLPVPQHSSGDMSDRASTRVGDNDDEKKGSGEYSEKPKFKRGKSVKGFEEKGLVEVDEEGKKKKVMLVVEERTGKEMFKEYAQGPYTIPRW
jgi:hypothetical protein